MNRKNKQNTERDRKYYHDRRGFYWILCGQQKRLDSEKEWSTKD